MNLVQLGWNDSIDTSFKEYESEGYAIGRISKGYKNTYKVITKEQELSAEVSGKFIHNASNKKDFPSVGDWVVLTLQVEEGKAMIHKVLHRFSKFSRKEPGQGSDEQIVATNINTVFLVISLNKDFNLRRIERYLITAWESGAKPVIVLSKSDICEEIYEKIIEVESVAIGVPIYTVSAHKGEGMDNLKKYCIDGETIALLGSSGSGKSTICNYLYGSYKQKVSAIRTGDEKGKHTTTNREMLMLPEGGILIDTPGMRELQLWDVNQSINKSFSDIEQFATQCLFRDCQHDNEPSCAVKAAIDQGELELDRFNNYVKFQRELAYLERKNDKKSQMEEKKRHKKIGGDRTRFNRK
ncbi:ribosome small subunit-dependent GTPase A [Pontibacillus salipaludis]|uniref:Small ribosomal subunit biogenesis GTPase RsgA n=1 Tax=Pontibacillus salipaludis TaxID=1697394 RepID=A0ABQ1QL08_9BACI|nr:ribosome small subunit-dependent GTPase A [Pontibacillus salipaludis]GGD29617.1 putative ribosome biogenesis GTPase RsgA [Pontibacillus salipaludis]